MTVQGPSSSRPSAFSGRAAAPAINAVKPNAGNRPRHATPRAVDLSQGRELSTRQWWRLHAGGLRRERKLLPWRLVQRILCKRKVNQDDDAAALLNYFFKTATVEDGPSCITLARHYVKDPAHRNDALDLYRAAETAGAMRDVEDVLRMAQLLVADGQAGDAVGLIAGHQRLAPTEPRFATWTGVAWLARACESASERPEFFAAAQERALKALRLAAILAPNDAVIADNVRAAEALYPGPNFGNIARAFVSPFCAAPDLRQALIAALEQRANYTVRRTYAVGTAIRYDSKQQHRQENVDAAQILRQA